MQRYLHNTDVAALCPHPCFSSPDMTTKPPLTLFNAEFCGLFAAKLLSWLMVQGCAAYIRYGCRQRCCSCWRWRWCCNCSGQCDNSVSPSTVLVCDHLPIFKKSTPGWRWLMAVLLRCPRFPPWQFGGIHWSTIPPVSFRIGGKLPRLCFMLTTACDSDMTLLRHRHRHRHLLVIVIVIVIVTVKTHHINHTP